MDLRRQAAVAAAVSALLAAAPAQAAPKKNGPAPCTTPAFTYSNAPTAPGGPTNDPLSAREWGLDQINAPAAWARGVRGAGAVIAVLDTGVDLAHPDLDGKLVPGVDLVETKNDCPAGPQDEQGHGTHVAGTAAAETGNGIGVAGVAPDARIMPVRVLDEDGSGSLDTIAAGIRWAADHGADVINMSLGELPIVGQSELLNAEIEAAVDYAWSKGAVTVAAAGNETFPLCSYPSAATNAICVGATDRRGLPSFYSSFPNDTDNVGVRAPGGAGSVFYEDDEDIWSTMWPGSDYDGGDLDGYETLAGTSMATPHVAGVVALLAGQGLTPAQILERIKTTSSNDGLYEPVNGYGIVDADAATR